MKFWAKAGLFILIFSVSFWAFDRLLFTIVRTSARHYYASLGQDDYKFRASIGKGDGDLLIFGTSRTYCGVASLILSSQLKKRVIIEAESGKFPNYFYFFYQKHRKSFPKPKLVLYGLDYFMFSRKSAPAHLARLRQGVRLQTMDIASAANAKSPLLGRISWLCRKKPDIDNYLIDLLRLEGEAGDGYEADKVLTKRKFLREEARSEKSAGRLDKPVRPDRWVTQEYRPFPGEEGSYFDRLLTKLERDHVPVVLMFIPDYVGTNETNLEQDKFKSDIKALAARHRGVHVLDFNRPEVFDLNNPDLFSQHGWGISNCHLSPEGRKIFTRQAVPAVKQILIRAAKTESPTKKRAR